MSGGGIQTFTFSPTGVGGVGVLILEPQLQISLGFVRSLLSVPSPGNHRNSNKCCKHIIPILLYNEVFFAWTFKDERLEISLNPQSDPSIKFLQHAYLPRFQVHATTILKILKFNIFVCSLPFHNAQITPPIF